MPMPQHAPSHTLTAAPADSAMAGIFPAKFVLHRDTARTDSAALKWVPQYPAGFPARQGNNAPHQAIDQLPIMQVPQGEASNIRLQSPLYDTGAMTLLLLGIVAVTMSFHSGYKYVENFLHNMFSIRKRENLFDDHTVSELGIMTALILNTCVMMSLATFYAMDLFLPGQVPCLSSRVFLHVGAFAALWGLFYLAQLGIYYVLGYVFTDPLNARIWRSGYKASMSLLGLLCFPVVVVLLVYPSSVRITLFIIILLYIGARLVFIYKGFRIFFNNISKSVFFILYLCSVEIVPPILYCFGAILTCQLLQS